MLVTAPRRSASRDKLMGVLWPEKDEEQARHLLSVAIYEIRKQLGEDVVVTRGDDLVLDPTVIVTDLDAFRSALEQGDLDGAVARYAGPFLDGFFLGGSPAFDQWMEEEREAIAREFRGALEQLADRHDGKGEHEQAVAAWRRLAAEDRYDSRIAIRLLKSLAAVGNRAGALQFARVHQALLREEFESDPTPEFTAAVAAIRESADAPARSPEPAQEPAHPAHPGHPGEPGEPAHVAAAPAAADPSAGPADVEPSGPTGGTRSIALLVVLVLMLLAAVVGGLFDRPATGPITIAVLPFAGEDEAFSDGLAEAILGVLGSVEGVRVPVWSAASTQRGVGASEAAAKLGVDHVLGGSVRREGAVLRIRVNLSDADGMRVWEEVYDRVDGSMFQTQDDIATSVLEALSFELVPGGFRPLVGGTRDEAAYNHYLRGRHAWYRRTPDGFRQALAYFQSAVEQDSTYARAYAGLADTYNLLGAYDYGLMRPDSAFPLARGSAERALGLAPNLAEAHAALAQTRFAYDRDWAGSEASFVEALRLNPRSVDAHHWYSLLLIATGRAEEALEAAHRAVMLDSVSTITHANMGRQLYYRGDYQAAEAAFQRALSLDPGAIPSRLGHGLVLMELGRPDEAAAIFARILEAAGQPHPVVLALHGHALGRAGRTEEAGDALARLDGARAAGIYIPPEYPALIHIGLGNLDQAVAGLEAAFRARSSAIAFLAVDPLAAPLRGHPGFERLALRAGLPGGAR